MALLLFFVISHLFMKDIFTEWGLLRLAVSLFQLTKITSLFSSGLQCFCGKVHCQSVSSLQVRDRSAISLAMSTLVTWLRYYIMYFVSLAQIVSALAIISSLRLSPVLL